MIKKALLLWVMGLLTAVPYTAYYLLFEAPREQYALLITFILFWIFGYWSLATPLIGLIKFRRLQKAFQNIKTREQLIAMIQQRETEAVCVDFIAQENGVPRFMAKWVYQHIAKGLVAAHTRSLGKT